MPHQNTVLQDLLKPLCWGLVDRLACKHGVDRDGRAVTMREHLIAMLYGQLAGAASLRAIETGLKSHASSLYHLGARALPRSTLAEVNHYRSAAAFSELFGSLVGQLAGRKPRAEVGQAVRLIDATVLPLSSRSARWATFSAGVCGAKAHVIYDPDADRPLYAAVTSAKINDITAAKQMPIEGGATYVFDLGYYDYAWWARMHKAGCRIVTRFKTTTPLELPQARPLPAGLALLSDRVGYLPARQAKARKNPMAGPVREIRVRTDNQKILRLFTNDLQAPAQEIADLYKRRWAIELFFRWVKQTLKIRHFVGASQNAVCIQIAVALIAFVLLRLAQQRNPIIQSPLVFARVLSANLMHRRPIARLLHHPPHPKSDDRQAVFAFLSSKKPRARGPISTQLCLAP